MGQAERRYRKEAGRPLNPESVSDDDFLGIF